MKSADFYLTGSEHPGVFGVHACKKMWSLKSAFRDDSDLVLIEMDPAIDLREEGLEYQSVSQVVIVPRWEGYSLSLPLSKWPTAVHLGVLLSHVKAGPTDVIKLEDHLTTFWAEVWPDEETARIGYPGEF